MRAAAIFTKCYVAQGKRASSRTSLLGLTPDFAAYGSSGDAGAMPCILVFLLFPVIYYLTHREDRYGPTLSL
jgi:hypothetical protein